MNILRVESARLVRVLLRFVLIAWIAEVHAVGDQQCDPPVKNVILFIGDGMQLEHEIAASRYLYGHDQGLIWAQFPFKGYATTWSATSFDRYAQAIRPARHFRPTSFHPALGYDPAEGGKLPFPLDPGARDAYFLTPLPTESLSESIPATDSAAAATALATGAKTDDGKISWSWGALPGRPLRTIAEALRIRRRKAVGVVSTSFFTDATPAAFISHNPSRKNYYTGYKGYSGLGIADEIIHVTQPDVVIGGGHPGVDNPDYDSGKGYVSKDLHAWLRKSDGYVFVERVPGVDGTATLMEAAARAAATGGKLFGLFGGENGDLEPPSAEHSPGLPVVRRVHVEDPMLRDMVDAALEVLSRRERGFFLMAEQGVIDHVNHQNDYRRMIATMYDLNEAVRAAVAFIDRPGDGIDWSNTLLLVTADHATGYLRRAADKPLGLGVLPVQVGSGPYAYPNGEVSYGTTTHTNELVTLYGVGRGLQILRSQQGRWYPGTRIIDNTQIHAALSQATLASGQCGARSGR